VAVDTSPNGERDDSDDDDEAQRLTHDQTS
jgi:hypothetical protein